MNVIFIGTSNLPGVQNLSDNLGPTSFAFQFWYIFPPVSRRTLFKRFWRNLSPTASVAAKYIPLFWILRCQQTPTATTWPSCYTKTIPCTYGYFGVRNKRCRLENRRKRTCSVKLQHGLTTEVATVDYLSLSLSLSLSLQWHIQMERKKFIGVKHTHTHTHTHKESACRANIRQYH